MDSRNEELRPTADGDAEVERLFPRDFDALDHIFEFISEFFVANAIEESNSFDVQLIIEELFTNLVKYSKGGTHEIPIRLKKTGEHLEIRLTDVDVEAFDMTLMPEVDTQKRISEKKVGGLGLHLVRKMAEDISYEYVDRQSRITILKRLES
jgi:serine/threonine-protein kinase RsbW